MKKMIIFSMINKFKISIGHQNFSNNIKIIVKSKIQMDKIQIVKKINLPAKYKVTKNSLITIVQLLV